MSAISKLKDFSDIRFQILKSMLSEFPELKSHIMKESLTDTFAEDGKKSAWKQIAEISKNPRLQHRKIVKDNHVRYQTQRQQNESVPHWALLSMAKLQKDSKGNRYYVFK